MDSRWIREDSRMSFRGFAKGFRGFATDSRPVCDGFASVCEDSREFAVLPRSAQSSHGFAKIREDSRRIRGGFARIRG